MIPRANRSIFVINELLITKRIQVALFSILEEKEIQIRGFKLRLPLDLQFILLQSEIAAGEILLRLSKIGLVPK